MTINSNRSIFIPKHTPDFQPMRYVFCETETVSKFVPRADFMRLLEQQPCPMAQVNIDLDGGYAYLFPYCPERAEAFIQLNVRWPPNTSAITATGRSSRQVRVKPN